MWKKFSKNAAFLGATAGNYGFIFRLTRLLSRRYKHLVEKETELCIEGFPRSGNTALVAAIQRWNPNLKISHHSHLAGNVKWALARGIPTAVVIREPEEAVASVMVWDNMVTPRVGLYAYADFYSSLGDALERTIVVPFGVAVNRPDRVVQALNRRFRLDLKWAPYSEQERVEIRHYLQRHDLRNERDATQSTLPNEEKRKLKRAAKERIRKSPLYGRARRAWEALSTKSDRPL